MTTIVVDYDITDIEPDTVLQTLFFAVAVAVPNWGLIAVGAFVPYLYIN